MAGIASGCVRLRRELMPASVVSGRTLYLILLNFATLVLFPGSFENFYNPLYSFPSYIIAIFPDFAS